MLVIPESDQKLEKLTKTFKLTQTDVSNFFKLFQKLDSEKLGLLNVEEFLSVCEEPKTELFEYLLEILEIQSDGTLNFTDFLTVVMTYCMFEPIDILKCK